MPIQDSDAPQVRHRPTMRDVAALAGVSLKTVSRVVNGVSSVDPGLTARVQDAAGKLGYRPNLTASSLRRSDRRTSTIGMLVGDVANPFSAALMRTVEDVARERKTVVLIGSLDDDPAREPELASALIDRRVDGLVIMPSSHDHSYLSTERSAGTCLVFVDRPPTHLDADAVVVDNHNGAVTGVQQLLDHGHRRIAYLGDRASVATASARFDGYTCALELARVPVEEHLLRQDVTDVDTAIAVTTALLTGPNPPTALFTSQNLVTIGASRALRTLGLESSVAMVGFDDFPLADMLRPGITVVAQDVEAIGRLAATVLFRRLDGDTAPSHTYVVPTRLIQRGSGEIAGPAPGQS
ncbi:MAG: LacI family transcriptional regulator [Pseudonocardia sp.]|nr:LacI family transcriptional regulator [Pseudonocardia sp.]